MRLLMKIFILSFIPFSICSAQPKKDSMTVGASSFKMTGMRNFLMGRNYRKEWGTPVTVKVLNLSTEYGGLTPEKKGGGKQTRSLMVEDPSGNQYYLRSIKKYVTDEALPPDLRGAGFVKDIVSDGVSASYPYATLSIPELARAAGVPTGNPQIVYLPDDPALGEYRADFGNSLMLFEARYPAGIKKGNNTEEMLAKLYDDNDNGVDQHAVLTARLLDNYIMDLDRHDGQWNWAFSETDKGKIFFPIPKDRDQAFFTSQGLVPSFARKPWIAPGIQGFRAKAININGFNFAARNFDRSFLTEPSRQEWEAAADKLLAGMTDDVIEKAMAGQPREIRAMPSDAKIIAKLKARRQYFKDEMMKYYAFLAQTVSVAGSDKRELFDVDRNADGSVHVIVYKINKDGQQSRKMYDRNFDPGETKEIRLYGLGGDDKFVVHGEGSKIKVRMIGGEGADEFDNTAKTSKGSNVIYDLKSESNKVTGKDFKNKISSDTAVNNYDRLGFKYNQVIPLLSLSYNPDDGIFLGYSIKIVKQGFRKVPYKTMHQFKANYAFSTQAYSFRYNSEFVGVIGPHTDILPDISIKAPNFTTNFFGYGNETIFHKNSAPNPLTKKFHQFYRARFNLGDFTLMFRHRFGKIASLSLGPTYEFYRLNMSDNTGRYILMAPGNGLDPATLFAKQSWFGGQLMLDIDTRNNESNPTKGIHWASSLKVLNGISGPAANLTQLSTDLSGYMHLGKDLVLALRAGVGHNFNDKFEFFQAQYLGGTENLRGYRKFRFAGTTAFYQNTDLRIKIADFRTYLFPVTMGFVVFNDVGKVWVPGMTSSVWHDGYGAGIWLSPLKKAVITVSYCASKEDKLPLISLGFQF